jgi:hypothetical protein
MFGFISIFKIKRIAWHGNIWREFKFYKLIHWRFTLLNHRFS